jgi:hypothetical protein
VAAGAGRKKHNWLPGTRDEAGNFSTTCKNCALTASEGWYEEGGMVLHVEPWRTPDGRLIRIRPAVWLEAPEAAPPLEGAFPGITIGGVPECPKSPEGWS